MSLPKSLVTKSGLAPLFAAAAMLATSSITLAQSADTPSNVPTSTTANFGDWVVRCRIIAGNEIKADNSEDVGTKAANKNIGNVCEMIHIIRIATRNEQTGQTSDPQVLAQIAIGKLPGTDQFKIVYQLPAGVWLRDPVQVRFADVKEELENAEGDKLQSASYFRCQGNACLADIDLTDTQITTMKTAKLAQLSFIDGTRRTINIPLSLKGFAGAFESLAQ